MLFLANVPLGVREPGVQVDPARRKSVGDRRGGGVRGLALAGFTVILCAWQFVAPLFVTGVFSFPEGPRCVSRPAVAPRPEDFSATDPGR
jgi:hypothetical protein